jgi:hypothetical protein
MAVDIHVSNVLGVTAQQKLKGIDGAESHCPMVMHRAQQCDLEKRWCWSARPRNHLLIQVKLLFYRILHGLY